MCLTRLWGTKTFYIQEALRQVGRACALLLPCHWVWGEDFNEGVSEDSRRVGEMRTSWKGTPELCECGVVIQERGGRGRPPTVIFFAVADAKKWIC